MVRMARCASEVADLARDHQLVAVHLAEEATEQPFGLAEAVDVGGVVERDAQAVCPNQACVGGVRVDTGPTHRYAVVDGRAADGPAAGPDRGHLAVQTAHYA